MKSQRMKETLTKDPKVTKELIYKLLIRLHKWTFDEIANLNRWQQFIAADVSLEDISDRLEFETMEDYLEWKAHK